MPEISSEEDAPSPAPSRETATFTTRLLAALQRIDVSELLVVSSLLTLCVSVRLLRLQPIEYYDDEVTRWHFVRQWFHANEFQHAVWTHHMARFGVNVPLFLVQALLGRQASIYYVWPLASFALQVLFTYATAKRLGGRGAGILAGILLSVFAGMDRGACQLLPDGFGATAMILVVYLMTYYHDAAFERRMPWLIGAALAFVWAYEIKESNLLLLPGTALGVWLLRARFRDGFLFGAIIILAIAIETLGFRIFTDYSSRFSIVGEAHGIAYSSFLGLFNRFRRLEFPWQILVWSWVPSALWLAGNADKRLRALVLVPTMFLLLLTFVVRSVNPIVLWTRFFSRYFEPAAPLMITAVGLFITQAAARACSTNLPARAKELGQRALRLHSELAIVACALVGAVEYAAFDPSTERAQHEVRRVSRITNDAYERNLPIVMQRPKRGEIEERRVRPLKLVYGIYLNDRQIMTSSLAKGGKLPEIVDAVRESKRHAYVLREPGAYGDGQVEEWVERGCAVVLDEEPEHPRAAPGIPSLVLKRSEKLPASCKPPHP